MENSEILKVASNEFCTYCPNGRNHNNFFHVPLKGSGKLSLRGAGGGGLGGSRKGGEVKYYLKHFPRHNKALK